MADWEQVGWSYKTEYGRIYHDIPEHEKLLEKATDEEREYLSLFAPVFVRNLIKE